MLTIHKIPHFSFLGMAFGAVLPIFNALRWGGRSSSIPFPADPAFLRRKNRNSFPLPGLSHPRGLRAARWELRSWGSSGWKMLSWNIGDGGWWPHSMVLVTLQLLPHALLSISSGFSLFCPCFGAFCSHREFPAAEVLVPKEMAPGKSGFYFDFFCSVPCWICRVDWAPLRPQTSTSWVCITDNSTGGTGWVKKFPIPGQFPAALAQIPEIQEFLCLLLILKATET